MYFAFGHETIDLKMKICKFWYAFVNLILLSFKSQESRRIVRSIGEDDDEDFDDLEALRLAALRSLGTKVRKGFTLDIFSLTY